MDLNVRKDSIRRLALAGRRRLTPAERTSFGAAILEQVTALPEFADAPSVLATASIHSEVPTMPLLEQVLAAGKVLLVPYVAEDGALRASPVGSIDELEPGYRGIPEPRARLPVEAASAGLVIVPGVAFDEQGGRLGYGGGFFDGFLAAAGARPRVGLCFETQLVEQVPMAPHDERVHIVVTERRVIRAR